MGACLLPTPTITDQSAHRSWRLLSWPRELEASHLSWYHTPNHSEPVGLASLPYRRVTHVMRSWAGRAIGIRSNGRLIWPAFDDLQGGRRSPESREGDHQHSCEWLPTPPPALRTSARMAHSALRIGHRHLALHASHGWLPASHSHGERDAVWGPAPQRHGESTPDVQAGAVR
jgi:hypothetical protein